ncbi:MAG: hypothetical protein Q8Q14_09455, partial [Gemmatimonadales bacterium]|nr:hypothetical protein [Gemmatimonadales bacterium]
MPLDSLLDRFDELPATRALLAGLPPGGARAAVDGLPGSSAAVLVATLARRLPQRVFGIVAPTPGDGERWLADLRMLLGDVVALYPQRESLGAEEPHYELAGERVETLEALQRGAVRLLVTTARATGERTAVPAALERARLVLEPGATATSLSAAVARLDGMGYARVPTVTEVAQFSVRGGILDVYGFGMAAPARVEWWGDDVVSLRLFDLDTQRSGETLPRVTVLPVRAERLAAGAGERGGEGGEDDTALRHLLELLPADTIAVIDQERAVAREVERAWADAAHHLDV